MAKLGSKLGLDLKDIKIKHIKLESTYDPCNVCKRELLLLQDRYKTTIEVLRPFYLDSKGNKQIVIDNDTFKKII